MHFTNVLRDFYTEWEAITLLSEQDSPKIPTITKNNPPLKWCDSFKNCLYNTYGVRKAPLLYVIRDSVEVTPESGADPNVVYDPLEANKAHGNSGSVLEDLILQK